ncbi:MAG: YbfB/YjiJ family MFS transporter, partial [Rhodospirillaceae bacterium]
MSEAPPTDPQWLRLAVGGGAALFVGMGLGRFSYSPMIPALAAGGGLSAAEAGYVGASNLAGFLLGVAMQPWLRRRIGERTTLQGALGMS